MCRPTYSDEKEPQLGALLNSGQSQIVQYVTKADLNNAIDALEKRLDERFERFDERFERLEKRFQDVGEPTTPSRREPL